MFKSPSGFGPGSYHFDADPDPTHKFSTSWEIIFFFIFPAAPVYIFVSVWSVDEI
jgi:hypothetical protein